MNDETPLPPSPNFAPRGLSDWNTRIREKIPYSWRMRISQHDLVSWSGNTWTRSVKAKLRQAENARFLEQFRYVIVASQLLDAHVNFFRYRSLDSIQQRISGGHPGSLVSNSPFSITGALATGFGAFSFVWMLYWARGGRHPHLRTSRILLTFFFVLVGSLIFYSFLRRQWLLFLRRQAVDTAAQFVAQAQEFDAVTSVALSIVQDVELVSRGYRLSTPLPPISQIEERSQTRRCSRLRRTLRSSLISIAPANEQAYNALRPLVDESDLEKYLEIYDLDDPQTSPHEPGNASETEDEETLRWLKATVIHLYNVRRLFLCCLLALPALGGHSDFQRWGAAVDWIIHVGARTAEETEKLKKCLLEVEQVPVPVTPRGAPTPGEERARTQLRKLGSLSHGIRGLQAKMHVLREESEKSLEGSVDVAELGSNLLAQYDSIGNDLRMLMQEWESGRATLASHIDRTGRRLSQLSGDSGRSPAVSLDGSTVVEGSPADALRALNGEDTLRPTSTDLNALGEEAEEEEEVFEAVATPTLPRSKLTREERIAKMRDDRAKANVAREKAQANTHMMRELESVISLRPRGGGGGGGRAAGPRIISV
ncbi:MAG: hypothetical protein M1816_006123 [Peltula sp. TS41687]|nr:MAG: hypothetical protein M1816_006123 [Peltula sp. TS41687]